LQFDLLTDLTDLLCCIRKCARYLLCYKTR